MKTHNNKIAGTQAEKNILQNALKMLEETTGVTTDVLEWQPKFPKGIADATLELKRDGKKARFTVEIKRALTPNIAGHVVAQLQRFKGPAMLVTRYVTPPMAEQLKKLEMGFIDMAGNAYINAPGLFIYVTGRKALAGKEEVQRGAAFRPTGLQVLFALLCQPELIQQPYRRIATAARVALGTVGLVLDDLQRLNYVVDRGKFGRKLVDTRRLLDTWVTLYAQRLRPKRLIGRFQGPNDTWWHDQNVDWRKFDAYLGGEPAAAKLTDYLKPGAVTIYTAGDLNQFLIKNRLKRDAAGNVEILKTFWHFDYAWNDRNLAPPLLIYADLIATADERNIETGKLIYEKYLAGPFGEN